MEQTTTTETARDHTRAQTGKRHRRSWFRSTSSFLTSRIMVNVGLGEHSVVLDLRLAEGRAVVADDDELALARPEGLEGGLVS
eukprot:765542-Hanusia_phi.AAC.1